MLDVIKSIINRKRSFLEAVDLILEDMESDEIVDSLLDDKLTDDSSSSEDSSSEDDSEDHFDFGDSGFLDGDSSSSGSPEVGDYGVDNSLDADNSAPEESPDDEISDIFAISVDTRTNTVRDILPVPPMNAADAVEGNSDAKLDSGFADECGGNPMDGFLDESSGIFFRGSKRRYFLEGIDDGSGSSDSTDVPSMDDSVPDAPAADGDSNQESEVTTKVKENISDDSNSDSSSSDSLDSLGDVPSDDSSSSSSDASSGNAKAKEKLKLISDINKKLFDLRDDIIDDIQ